jgi:hypothetical protein
VIAWGFTEARERVLLAVMLGMRESHEDWLALARDLIGRGLGAPMLIVADGAPGLIKVVEQCWRASDRQHCAAQPKHLRRTLRIAFVVGLLLTAINQLDVMAMRADHLAQVRVTSSRSSEWSGSSSRGSRGARRASRSSSARQRAEPR